MATTYKGSVGTFRTTGVASANHNVFTIFNKTGSAKYVKLKQLSITLDDTGVLTTISPSIQSSRITALPSGGTVITPVPFDTNLTHDTNVECMGATASDGGAATTITSTAGNRAWSQFKMRVATAVGQIIMTEANLLPEFCQTDPIILRALEGIQVQMVQASATTALYVVNCAWEETDSIP